jgi:uncharacterized protein YoxC
METLAKADVFFVITGVAIILVTLFILAVLFYILKILRDVEDITDSVRDEAKNIVEDVSFVRRHTKKGVKKVINSIRPSSYTKKAKKK